LYHRKRTFLRLGWKVAIMNTRLNLSSEVEQWLINLMNNLAEMYRKFVTVYNKVPLPLLASFVGRCGGIWRVGPEDNYYIFKCGEMYFLLAVGSYISGEILSEAGHNPIARRLLVEIGKARTKEKRYLKATRFKVQLGANLLAYHGYMFPIGKIRGKTYNLCRIFASETLNKTPFIQFSDECIEDEYTYEVSIELTDQGPWVLGYENKEDPNLPPADLLNALYEKRDEIERRVNPTLKVLDEVTKGAISILLY
jgi:hypothetical protein